MERDIHFSKKEVKKRLKIINNLACWVSSSLHVMVRSITFGRLIYRNRVLRYDDKHQPINTFRDPFVHLRYILSYNADSSFLAVL